MSQNDQEILAAVIVRRSRWPDPATRRSQQVQWLKDAERAVGMAPHAFSCLPIANTLAGAALHGANEERLQALAPLMPRAVDAVFDGYALACVLTRRGGDNSGTAFARGADATRFAGRSSKLGKALKQGELAAIAAQLVGCDVEPGLRVDAEVALYNALAAGLLLHDAEHDNEHPDITALRAVAKKPAIVKARQPQPTHVAPNAVMIAAILGAPDDDGPRLVYADWLTERGDPRGEFIQVQCTLGHSLHGAGGRRGTPTGRPPAEVEALKEREKALVKANELRWLPHPRCFREWGWRRGFLSALTASTQPLLDGFSTLLREPIESLKLTSFRDAKSFKAPALFDLSPHPTLRRLDFSSNKIDAKKMAVVGMPFFSQLSHLDLGHNDLSDPAAMGPLVKGAFPNLRQLRLAGARLTLESLERLAQAAFFPRLTHLRLYLNPDIGPDGVKVLEGATSLREVDVGNAGFDEPGIRALIDRGLAVRMMPAGEAWS